MKISWFNRPYIGSQGKIDRVALITGLAAVAATVVSYTWVFPGG